MTIFSRSFFRMALYGTLAASTFSSMTLAAVEDSGTTAPKDLSAYRADRTGKAVVPEGYKLVWSDEFNGKGRPNPKYWSPEKGFTRNKEMQWYQLDNARQRNGVLVIEGRKETFPNPNYEEGSKDWKKNRKNVEYTSTCLITNGKFSARYGIFEMRARFNPTEGMWPAFWTLGTSEIWPSSGEIDILEYYKEKYLANLVWGTKTKWVGHWSSKTKALKDCIAKDPKWASKFHTYRLVWDKDFARIYIDGELVNETNLSKTNNERYDKVQNPFRQEHYILINLALGANGGSLDKLKFPARYEVDYVRVFQKKDCPDSTYTFGKKKNK